MVKEVGESNLHVHTTVECTRELPLPLLITQWEHSGPAGTVRPTHISQQLLGANQERAAAFFRPHAQHHPPCRIGQLSGLAVGKRPPTDVLLSARTRLGGLERRLSLLRP